MSPSRPGPAVGLIATGGVDRLWPGIEDLVDVVEVEPQTLWESSRGSGRIGREALDWLRGLERPLLCHGVGFPVGGTCPPEPDGVVASARSADHLEASHWSEHLSFNRVTGPDGPRHAGYLLPPVPTTESVAAAVAHIGRFQRLRDTPFLVETPTSYLRPGPGDLTDGDFVAAVAEGADCGILLDLHNIWANELNGRQPVEEFLARIPLDRVLEVHVAGGDHLGDCYLDSHVGPVAPEVLDMARRVLPRLPNLRAVLFEAVPHSVAEMGVKGLRGVLADLHTVVEAAGEGGVGSMTRRERPARETPPASAVPAGEPGWTSRREAALLGYTTRATDAPPEGEDDPGADVLRHLTDQARLSLLVGTHRVELATLLTRLGRERARVALEDFLASAPASAWRDEQAAAFDHWFSGVVASGALDDQTWRPR